MNAWSEVLDHQDDDDNDDDQFVCTECGWDAQSFDGLVDHMDWHDWRSSHPDGQVSA